MAALHPTRHVGLKRLGSAAIAKACGQAAAPTQTAAKPTGSRGCGPAGDDAAV